LHKSNQTNLKAFIQSRVFVFLLFWVVLFLLYLPAAKAGFIEDFIGWVHNVTTMKFWDYINRTESHIPSLYQFTQFITYLLYQMIGNSYWGWHLLYITLQSINSFLLFVLCKGILTDSGISRAWLISFGGAFLYTICPHISEVVVWEPAYHYLQGFLMILLILLWVQKFHNSGKGKYAWFAGILYFLSTFSLELFYLTPWFVFTLAIYYRVGLHYDRILFRKSLLYFLLPQLLFFANHFILLQHVYHIAFAHIGQNAIQPATSYLQKPAKYFFNILFFGKYFHGWKIRMYNFLDSTLALEVFYSLVLLAFVFIVWWFKKMGKKAKAASLFFVWTWLCMALITPLWWQDYFLISYDRYTYVLDAFLYVNLAVLVSYITIRYVAVALWLLYVSINIYYTHKAVWYWKTSAAIMDKLIQTFPNDPSKTILLLNLPECLDGAPLIGAQPEGGFKIMNNTFYTHKINNKVYDVMCYNMITPNDGADVATLNDSTIQVTLKQWGTWWQYQHMGGHSYENEDFRINMTDVGHAYELTLKKPAQQYKLLYIIGDTWHVADLNKKNKQ